MIRPQPITVDGRTGVIVFLNAARQPVAPDDPEAVVAKALFDGGGVAFFEVGPSARHDLGAEPEKKPSGKWNPSLHPRASDGEFTEGSGSPSVGRVKSGYAPAGPGEIGAFPKATAAPAPTPTSEGHAAPAPKPQAAPKPRAPTHKPAPEAATRAKLTTAMQALTPEEKAALLAGYEAVLRAGSGDDIEEFFAYQVALYRHADEGDPRLRTWFSGDTLTAMQGDEDLNVYLEGLAAYQSTPSALPPKYVPEPVKKAQPGTPKGGGGKAAPAIKPGKEASGVEKEVGTAAAAMSVEEQQALMAGFAAAKAAGYAGTAADYFVYQAALYQYAPEGDPRFGTWFSAETLSKVEASPTLWARVQQVAGIHQKPVSLGGAGSGNFGHAGRPGERGGSAPAGGSKGEPSDVPSDVQRAADRLSSPQFQKWFGDSAVVDEDGDPLRVYHGTTHDLEQFKAAGEEGLNPESDWGAGVYFTSEPEDASENYAGEGPDLTSRLESRADEIESELERDDEQGGVGRTWDETTGTWKESDRRAAAMAQARLELTGKSPSVIPAYLTIKKPFVVGEPNGTSGTRETHLEVE